MEQFMPFEKPQPGSRDEEERRDLMIHHSADLFDQDEDAAGQKIDEATGKQINNSENIVIGGKLKAVMPGESDALPELPPEEDAAAKWLKENDPDLKKFN